MNLSMSGLPKRLPSQCPASAPSTDAAVTTPANMSAISGLNTAAAMRMGSGGKGDMMDSVKATMAMTGIAQSLAAKPSIQWDVSRKMSIRNSIALTPLCRIC